VRMHQTRTRPLRGESPPGFKCQTQSTRMPLMPAIRPVSSIDSTEARPISAPPTKAEIGSNSVTLQAPNQNLACRVLPVGVVICTAPFGSLGIATLDVPVSLLSPAGASGMRCGLPSMTKIAVPL